MVNLGTGQGYSVLEALATYGVACGRDLPHQIVERRPGDAAVSCADVSLARKVRGFETCHDLRAMYESNWAFSGKAGP